MTFTPVGDTVIVRQDEAITKTASGLLIPDNAQKKESVGEIVYASAGYVSFGNRIPSPIGIQAGARILFKGWAGTKLTIDGEELTLIKHEDIIGIL